MTTHNIQAEQGIQARERELAEARRVAAENRARQQKAQAERLKQAVKLAQDQSNSDFSRSLRTQAVTSTFSKLATIFGETGDRVRVSSLPNGPYGAPAWTDGASIWLTTQALMDALTPEGMVAAKGLLWHELSHIRFSPTFNSTPYTDVKRTIEASYGPNSAHGRLNTVHLALNILEDHRIERMFTGLFPVAAKYFEATVLRFIIDEHKRGNGSLSESVSAFILTCERLYLPRKLRKSAFDTALSAATAAGFPSLHAETVLKQMHRLIAEYAVMVFPKDGPRGAAIAIELDELLSDLQVRRPNIQHTDRDTSSRTTGDQRAAQEAAAEAAEEEGKQAEEESSAPQPGGESSDDTEDSTEGEPTEAGEGDSTEGGEHIEGHSGSETLEDDDEPGEASSESTASDAEVQDASTTEPGDRPGSGIGAGTGEMGEASLLDEIEEALREAIQEVYDDAVETVADVKATLESWRHNGPDLTETIGEFVGRESAVVPVETVQLARRIEGDIDRIRAESGAGWNRHVDHGRLSVPRAMVMHRTLDTDVFDSYEDKFGDQVDCEFVLLADVSGSMNSKLRELNEAIWIMKTAAQNTDTPLTAICFGHEYVVAYNAQDRAHPQRRAHQRDLGGTYPAPAIEHARKVLSRSQARNRIFMLMTDGEIWDNDATRAEIESLRAIGVFTHLTYFHNGYTPDTIGSKVSHTSQIRSSLAANNYYGCASHSIAFDLEEWVRQFNRMLTAGVSS